MLSSEQGIFSSGMKSDNMLPLRGFRVLLLDDDKDMCKLVEKDLSEQGCSVETATDGLEGLHVLMQRDFDVLLVDLRMPNMDGAQFVREVRKIWPWLGIVVASGYVENNDPQLQPLRDAGITRFLPKPFVRPDLRRAMGEEALEKRHRVEMAADLSLDHIQYQLSLLRRFSEAAFAADSLNEAFRSLSLGLGTLMPCSVVGILNMESNKSSLVLTSLTSVAPSFLAQVKSEMAARYEALSGHNFPAESRTVHYEGEPTDERGTAAIGNTFSLPVIAKGQVQGLLTFASGDSQPYTRQNMSFLYHAANLLSTVLTALNRIRQLAARDAMTGLYNRRGLEEEMERAWQSANRLHRSVGVLIIDIDHFKTLNDSYGHLVGDQIIREFAQIVQDTLRPRDIAGRYGGDEFVMILPDLNEAETRATGEKLLDAVRKRVFCEKAHGLRLAASIGGSARGTEAPARPASEILVQADQALYVAKRSGRNRLCMWSDPELRPVTSPTSAQDVRSSTTARDGTPMPQGHILIIDDDPVVGDVFRHMLQNDRYAVTVENNGAAALETLKMNPGRFDVAFVDLMLAGESGLDLLDKLAAQDDSLIRVVITGQATVDNAVSALRRGAYDFIQKPILSAQLQAAARRALIYRRLVIENRRYQLHLEDMVREKSMALSNMLDQITRSYDFTLEALAAVIDAREHQTGQHSLRVARLTRILSSELGLSREEIEVMAHGALLHDIGKIAIPDSILLKPGPLDPHEWDVVKTHPEIGYRILKSSPFLQKAADIVRQHQERYDGSGYPLGLRGEEICLGARIFAVTDSYDAMRSRRAYSEPRSPEAAAAEITGLGGKKFDPKVVKAFIRCIPALEESGGWDRQETAQTTPAS